MDNAALIINRSNNYSMANGISGTGSLTQSGGGATELTGTNSYTGGTIISAGTLVAGNDSAFGGTGAQTVTFNGGKLASNNDGRALANDLVLNNVAGNQITGSSSLTLTGNASGAGTLQVNLTDASKSVTVNTATTNGFAPAAINVTTGTLLLGGSDKIADATALNLSGGAFSLQGLSGASETLGALTLSANSTIDFGTGTGNTLAFSGLALGGFSLAVRGWSGPFYLPGQPDTGTLGDGQDRLLFTTLGLTETELAQISFYNDAGTLIATGQQISFGVTPELVPVPEPTTILGAVALLGLAGWRERRRLRSAWQRAAAIR